MQHDDTTNVFGMPIFQQFEARSKSMRKRAALAAVFLFAFGLGFIATVGYLIVDQLEKSRAHDIELQRIGAERTGADVPPPPPQ